MAENNQFKCSGNCLQCLPAQRQYCASQHAYSNMLVLDKIMELLGKLQEDMTAILSNETSVFDPKKETAQEEDGAENRSSHK